MQALLVAAVLGLALPTTCCAETLQEAAAEGRLDRVKAILLRDRALVNRVSDGYTAVWFAARNGHTPVVAYLIENGAKVGADELCIAAGNGHADVVDLLLSSGVDVNAATRSSGDTALHAARNRETAELLVRHGADVHARNDRGETPLHCVRDKAVAEVLLASGAMVNAHANDYRTPLEQVSSAGDFWSQEQAAICELLISKGATMDPFSAAALGRLDFLREVGLGTSVRREDQRTLLHVAAAAGQAEVAEHLLSNHIPVDAVDRSLNTALHYAAMNGHGPVVAVLLRNGADVNARNLGGSSPLDEATLFHQEDVRELLREHGAKAFRRERNVFLLIGLALFWVFAASRPLSRTRYRVVGGWGPVTHSALEQISPSRQRLNRALVGLSVMQWIVCVVTVARQGGSEVLIGLGFLGLMAFMVCMGVGGGITWSTLDGKGVSDPTMDTEVHEEQFGCLLAHLRRLYIFGGAPVALYGAYLLAGGS